MCEVFVMYITLQAQQVLMHHSNHAVGAAPKQQMMKGQMMLFIVKAAVLVDLQIPSSISLPNLNIRLGYIHGCVVSHVSSFHACTPEMCSQLVHRPSVTL